MRGGFAVTDETVKHNSMGWGVFDFVKEDMKAKVDNPTTAGWWAYKKIRGVWYFHWAERGDLPSDKVIMAYRKDGYSTAVTSTMMQEHYKNSQP